MSKKKPASELDRVFTCAVDSAGDPDLIFSSLDPTDRIATPQTLKLIQNHPLVHQIVGYPNIVYTYDDALPYQIIRVTSIMDNTIAAQLPAAKKEDYIYVNSTPLETANISLAQIYDKCALPHKYALGCNACIRLNSEELPDSCVLHDMANAGIHAEHSNEYSPVDDPSDYLQSSVTTIGPFTYISPTLTRTEHFSKKERTISCHDFSAVTRRSADAANGGKESQRIHRFKAANCTRCLVRATCDAEGDSKQYCKGAYFQTEKEATADILEAVHVPFTRAQIKHLLAHSGPLAKRYNRRLYHLTFHATYRELNFGLRRTTATYFDFEPFATYKDAVKVINEYGYEEGSSRYRSKLTNHSLALLIALSAQTDSPRRRNNWRTFTYPKLGIEPSYEGYTLAYARGKEGYLPWKTTITKLEDVYSNWRDIPHCSQG